MNESDCNQLRETSWRRELTPAEREELRAMLAAHPEARADWEMELGLTDALGSLPDVSVASNFTALVLQAIEREDAAMARDRQPRWKVFVRSFLPRAAVATVVAAIGFLSVHEYREHQRERLAESVATVSGVASLPSPEILQDFDVINQMGRTPAPDKELLALMQ